MTPLAIGSPVDRAVWCGRGSSRGLAQILGPHHDALAIHRQHLDRPGVRVGLGAVVSGLIEGVNILGRADDELFELPLPGKTGVVYTLDRETGEFLWATPTVAQNVISHIDGATGAVTANGETVFTANGQQVVACPTLHGGKDWEAGAYSPLTNMMYFPLHNTCARMTAKEGASPYGLQVRDEIAPGTDNVGTVYAISAETGEIAWKYEQRAIVTSLVATGGGLIFGGDANGRFRALDQQTGKVLWETNLGSPVTGFPITYAVGGRQYVAVSTGTSSMNTNALMRLTPELRPSTGNSMFVFALPK